MFFDDIFSALSEPFFITIFFIIFMSLLMIDNWVFYERGNCMQSYICDSVAGYGRRNDLRCEDHWQLIISPFLFRNDMPCI